MSEEEDSRDSRERSRILPSIATLLSNQPHQVVTVYSSTYLFHHSKVYFDVHVPFG